MIYSTDDSCALLPSQRSTLVEVGLRNKLISYLCMRYCLPPTRIKAALPKPLRINEWSRMRLANDGDTIRAASFLHSAVEDGRDCTHIRVSVTHRRTS